MTGSMRTWVMWAGLCAVAVALGCRSTPAKEPDPGFRTLLRGYQSGVAGRAVHVATSEPQWQELWSRHASILLPRPQAPEVDWQREMIVAVFLGERPTAGFGVEVRALRAEDGRLVVEAHETRPPADRLVPQVITQPYHFVAAPRAEGEARLELR